MTLRLWQALKPRLVAEHRSTVYETLERPLVDVLARMEERGIMVDRQILSRLSGDFAQALDAPRGRDPGDGRREVRPRLAEADRRHPVRQDGSAGCQEDAVRPMGDARDASRRTRSGGPCASREDPRMAAAREAEIDLYRHPAAAHASGDEARAYLLRACRDDHGTAVLLRAEPAEHPDPHRGRTQDPDGLRRAAGPQDHLRRLQPDRTAHPRPYRRHPAAAGRPSRRASTSTRRPPRRCSAFPLPT